MNKKAYCSVLIIIAQIFLLFNVQAAVAGIVGSSHDFSPLSGPQFVGDNEQVCIYCHTPHGAKGVDRFAGDPRIPLWNRSLHETQAYTLYDSPTFDGKASYSDTKPRGYSLLCLSCHDGISNLNELINGTSAAFTPFNNLSNLTFPTNPKIEIGTDLRDDHPVSFSYDGNLVSLDPAGLKSPGVGGASLLVGGSIKLPLYAPFGIPANSGGTLECPTCHDPHDNSKGSFLRASNAGSQLCLTCHIK
jgi:predicted CXXCH cytochrome family protein